MVFRVCDSSTNMMSERVRPMCTRSNTINPGFSKLLRRPKSNNVLKNATLIVCISVLPLVSSSLGPLPTPQVSIRTMVQRQIIMLGIGDKSFSESRRPSNEFCDLFITRGGAADYIGDDESSWKDGRPEMQTQTDQDVSSNPHPQSHSAQPPYGPGPPWQQNNHWSLSREWQSWDESQTSESRNPQSNPDVRFASQNTGYRDEPRLPGPPQGPVSAGHPQQKSYLQQQGRFSDQQYAHHEQQQRPRTQGMYPPPPNLPSYGDRGVHENQLPASHSSIKIYNANVKPERLAPPGYDDEEDDDWLPFRDDAGEESGLKLPKETHQGSGDSSGMDLSQFDKDVIFSGLKRLYRKKIRPLEISSKYGHFHSPPLSPSDFDAKPMVLLLGQYSVGKTSFIRYLLGRDFPGQRIGPEPTTDRFVAIIKGESGDKVIPGAALCSQADRPFRGLSPFGNNFLSRFEGVEMDSPILNNITLVDTPGILSGQKQMIGRNYDYEQVMKWFAERADLIIVMFDAHKLDISDELKRVIEILKPHQDKMRILLNKADSISTQQLMRVYGALMWSLGKVMMTPEVCRVYMGSFWGAPLKNKEQAALLTQEKLDLFNDIAQLPQNAVMRRINELVKRARSVKVHAYIIHYLRKQLPYTWGKREKQRRLIDRLDREFVMCARRYELPRGDFPELEPFRQALLEIKDLSEIHKLDKKMVKEMDKVFSVDIPNLLEAAKYH
ncbi:hypothetical protein ACHAWX_002116 [Stephanocyclus meneghinianus]